MINIHPLDSVPFETIGNCFLRAFDDYFVKMPQDLEYYRTRWDAAGASYGLSFGAFDDQQLVGFIIHCIDQRDGHLIAFNTGTGVIPAYRGRGITSLIYKIAIPVLKARGVSRSKLEVVQQNVPALKVYGKNGFTITRNYKCFQGKISNNDNPSMLQQIDASAIPWDHLPNQHLQSWDHQIHSLLKGPYNFYKGLLEGKTIGYLAVSVRFKYLALLEITSGDKRHFNNLLSGLAHLSEAVKINNIEVGLSDKIHALELAGLKNTIDQYEMELELD